MNIISQVDKNEILDDIFDNSFVAVIVVDRDRKIKIVNDAFCTLLGYSFEELENKSTEIFHINNNYFNKFRDIAVDKIKKKQSVNIEYEFKKKDGSTFWVKISGNPAKNENNILWMLIDISETIKTRNKLQEQTDLLKTVINENPNPIVLKDYDAKFVLVNTATAILYNSTPEEMIGKDDADYIPDKELSDFFKKNVQEIMKEGKTQIVYEDSIDVKTNETRNYMSIKKPFKNKDGKDFILVLANDVTELNQKNKELITQEKLLLQQSKLASMGEMIGNIAHQWRQPLSSISVQASGIKMEKELGILNDSDFTQAMDNILNSTLYLSQTIEDFRTFYDPQNSKITAFGIEEMIHQTLGLISIKLKGEEISVITDIQKIEIESFKNELIQVILNIINNAKDALHEIEGQKIIKIVSYMDREHTYIEISDNAHGIPADIIDKVFEPYFTTKHQSVGTGIGLFMSEEIIKKHLHGEISVDNDYLEVDDIKYKGAKFTIKLPYCL